MIGLTHSCQSASNRFAVAMCGRLNQFAKLPALSIAGKALRVERRNKKSREDAKSEVQVIYNICPTDYADVLTMATGEVGVERMRFVMRPLGMPIAKPDNDTILVQSPEGRGLVVLQARAQEPAYKERLEQAMNSSRCGPWL